MFILVISEKGCLDHEAAEFTKGLSMLWVSDARRWEDHTPIPDAGLILAVVGHFEGVWCGSEVWYTILETVIQKLVHTIPEHYDDIARVELNLSLGTFLLLNVESTCGRNILAGCTNQHSRRKRIENALVGVHPDGLPDVVGSAALVGVKTLEMLPICNHLAKRVKFIGTILDGEELPVVPCPESLAKYVGKGLGHPCDDRP